MQHLVHSRRRWGMAITDTWCDDDQEAPPRLCLLFDHALAEALRQTTMLSPGNVRHRAWKQWRWHLYRPDGICRRCGAKRVNVTALWGDVDRVRS